MYAKEEVANLEDKLKKKWGSRLEIDVLQDASGMRLNEIIRKGKYHVIHYAGHIHFAPKAPGAERAAVPRPAGVAGGGPAASHITFAQKAGSW